MFGLDPASRSDRLAIRRRLGYLPQQAGLYSGFSAFDLVDYVAVLKEWNDRDRRHDEVRRVLELVDLTADMHRRIRSMSGGMQRRVAIAAALIGSPELLVLDEPSAGLDPEQRLRLRSVLSAAGRQGCVVVSTHLTDEVAALCNRVLVLDHGRVHFDDDPERLASVAEWSGLDRRRSRHPAPCTRGSPPTDQSAVSARPRAVLSWSSRRSTTGTSC